APVEVTTSSGGAHDFDPSDQPAGYCAVGSSRYSSLRKREPRGVSMPEAYIVDAVRTAGGRKGGALKDWHPADMAAQVLNALVDRTGVDPAAIDDVIMGCVGQAGEQAFHIGRNAVL